MNKMSLKIEEKQPLISIIVPCYNGEKFISKAIDSVLNQTYKNFELIVVNDGSNDNSKEVINKYLYDKRIIYIEHKKNKGIPAARNIGIKRSKGKFITFLDQDDLFEPEKLKKQVELFEKGNDDIGLIYTNIIYIDENGKIIDKLWSSPFKHEKILKKSKKEIVKNLFLHQFIPLNTIMVRKECFEQVGLLDENIFGGSDDYEFCLRVASEYKIEYINLFLSKHRIHAGNFSRMDRFFKDLIKIIDKLTILYPWLNKYKKKKLGHSNYLLGKYYLMNSELSKARKRFIKAISNNPLLWKSYIAYFLSFLGKYEERLISMFQLIKRLTSNGKSK